MDRILTVEQMTFCEHEAEKYGVSLAQLMDNAAAQLSEVIASNSSSSSKIVLLIGKGNNGGDGLVAANLLAEQGLKPAVVLCCGEPDTDLSSAAYARLDKSVEVLKMRWILSRVQTCLWTAFSERVFTEACVKISCQCSELVKNVKA